MLDLLVRSVIVGGLASCAAWLFERALRNAGLGVRHAWTGALIATATLPFLPRLFETTSTLPVPVITMPAITFSTAAVGTDNPVDYVRLAWIILAGCVACVYALAYARLRRARRSWRRAMVAEHDVDISDRFGPAIFGFLTPRIVVPQWVCAAEPEEQRLIVRHEREHIRAGDHLQLLLTLVATVVMPWNPFVWLQTRKLRFALEADCDRRVLEAIPDRKRYAMLLVDVGSRQMGLFLTPALAEHRNGLERRIIMLAERIRRNWWKAGTLAVLGIGITIVACESRLPQESDPQVTAVVSDLVQTGIKREGTPAPFPTVSELMARHYPPALREAGVGGTVMVQARIYASGKVERVGVVKSSGNPALDAAALKVLNDMPIFPARTAAGEEPQNLIENYALEFDPNRKVERLEPTQRHTVQDRPSKSKVSDWPAPSPYTQRPELINRDETSRALIRSYPAELRDAGIGGRAVIWVLVGETGDVIKTDIKTSSSVPALDAAALKVGSSMKFKPALNGAEEVPVWIALPVVFKTQ
jgi:TonB family protein